MLLYCDCEVAAFPVACCYMILCLVLFDQRRFMIIANSVDSDFDCYCRKTGNTTHSLQQWKRMVTSTHVAVRI